MADIEFYKKHIDRCTDIHPHATDVEENLTQAVQNIREVVEHVLDILEALTGVCPLHDDGPS